MRSFQLLIVLWVAVCFSPVRLFAELPATSPSVTNLFIDWKDRDSVLIFGHFSPDRKHRITDFQKKLNQVKRDDIEMFLKDQSGGAMLLFHCMWGQLPGFHRKKYLVPFDQILEESGDTKTFISVIWHAGGLNYLGNYERSIDKGKPISEIIVWISAHFEGRVHTICHSMGATLFEGIMQAVPDKPDALFKTLTFFSADADTGIDKSNFANCINKTEQILVYMHRKDRLLWISSKLHRRKRLGRSGPSEPLSKMEVIDMTSYASSLSNHTHTDNDWVMEKFSNTLFKK